MSSKQIKKQDSKRQLADVDTGAFEMYQNFFVGSSSLSTFLKYEVSRMAAASVPGALGYFLRKTLFPGLFRSCGPGAKFGRNLYLRHPGKIDIGRNFGIDDNCMLDARGVGPGEFRLGDDVMIARGTTIASKSDHGTVSIGDNCNIGRNCILSSTGGIQIGESVGIGSQTFLGGGRYRTKVGEGPMIYQDMYSEGPVVIGDDVWIGVGVKIMDGVTIGSGSIIGAGAIVREDIPEHTVVTPHQRNIQVARSASAASEQDTPDPSPEARELAESSGDGMPADDEGVRESVYRAIEALNETLPPEERLETSPDTPLHELDSIDKVNLIVETETAIKERFGRSVDLADQQAAAAGVDPFQSVKAYSSYVQSVLQQ